MTPSTGGFRLDGKHALVTGGASGIGEATCRELARAGAIVIIADIDLQRAQALEKTLPRAKATYVDVAQRESIDAAAAQLERLDILVNNAGIAHVGDIAHVEPEDFDRLMEINVKSVYLVTRALLPLLLQRRGSIVNIGSVAGLVGIKQRARQTEPRRYLRRLNVFQLRQWHRLT